MEFGISEVRHQPMSKAHKGFDWEVLHCSDVGNSGSGHGKLLHVDLHIAAHPKSGEEKTAFLSKMNNKP